MLMALHRSNSLTHLAETYKDRDIRMPESCTHMDCGGTFSGFPPLSGLVLVQMGRKARGQEGDCV